MKRGLEQNPPKVEQWLNKANPQIIVHAKAEGARIYWGDETAVAEDRHWLRGYAPVGQTPPVLAAPSEQHGLTIVPAISNQGLAQFEFIEGAIKTDLMIEFIYGLIADSIRKFFLILSNLRAHHAKLVTEWLQEHRKKIDVFYLPPYSPELNPDEYLNREFKARLRLRDRAPQKSALLGKASAFMEPLKETLQRVIAYFKHSAVRYASLRPAIDAGLIRLGRATKNARR